MTCDCFKKVDAKLKEKGLQLAGFAFLGLDFQMLPQIATRWVDRSKRGKPPAVMTPFCPFCGAPSSAPPAGIDLSTPKLGIQPNDTP